MHGRLRYEIYLSVDIKPTPDLVLLDTAKRAILMKHKNKVRTVRRGANTDISSVKCWFGILDENISSSATTSIETTEIAVPNGTETAFIAMEQEKVPAVFLDPKKFDYHIYLSHAQADGGDQINKCTRVAFPRY